MARLCVFCLSALSIFVVSADQLNLDLLAGSTPGFTTAQCPFYLPGNLNDLQPRECPLPGLLGIIPDLPAPKIWSQPPQCIISPPLPGSGSGSGSENATDSDPDSGGALNCLFVDKTFRSHGIALLTSTTMASNLLGMGGLIDRPPPPAALKRDSLSLAEGKEKETETGTGTGSGAGTSVGKAYKVVKIPENGKGKGIVTTRRVRQGEILMVDTPAILVSVDFLVGTKSHIRRRWLRRAVASLEAEVKGDVEALGSGSSSSQNPSTRAASGSASGSISGSKTGGKENGQRKGNEKVKELKGKDVEKIFGTNTNTVVLGGDGGGKGGEAHVGIWSGLARINHSCRPK